MLDVNTETNADVTTLNLKGRLDTSAAPAFEKAVAEIPKDTATLVLECTDLRWLSSSALRVILSGIKAMQQKNGTVIIRHPNELVMEILDATGFTDLVTVEHAEE